MILGPDSQVKNPRLWLGYRIRSGQFHAYRVGGKYVMSLEQIDAARAA